MILAAARAAQDPSFIITGWAGVAMAVLGLAGLLGGAVAYFNQRRIQGLMEAYKANNDELERSVDLLKSHVARCEHDLDVQRGLNLAAVAKAVVDAMTEVLLRPLETIVEEMRGVAIAQDSQAEALGNFLNDMRGRDMRHPG